MERAFVAVSPCASVTSKVTLVGPLVADAVPVIAPVVEFKESPLGSVPEVIDQVYEPVPDVAVRVCEYGVPAPAAGRGELVVMEGNGNVGSEMGAMNIWRSQPIMS